MKPLKVVKYLVVHCVANRCNKPFSVESLINCGKQKYGQVSYHWYVRRNGDIIPLLSESVQGIHVKGYNWCSLGIVYEGGLDEQGQPADTRTEAQKHSLYELLKDLSRDYPDARIVGHCELPHVVKKCPCYPASIEYANLQPENREHNTMIVNL
ncbi:N-acetylmuramoyl-L-alanine amidase [uncultured Prevotella sp.]|uniref:N-acetylmuramoyl-L-alanine amidase n=1 Tax=uncultured Prevotella sp. TaxID=159272 RepID=UPI0025F8AA5A|nr:N-acetylmuramoyl-L-alanine amidase [uncultured Prevotella sp.]